ncbi:MAG: helix-turn-helix transcriptional regulator [Eubacterium sp.]|nr:helix-turn-helix transcriptional regulator [Eubacterium sp.]
MNELKTGEVICKRRKELGLTQTQLAQKLNLSFQAVSKWENGIRGIRESCLGITMTGCFICAGRRSLTAIAVVFPTSTVWIR